MHQDDASPYLVDTNVLSAGAPTKAVAAPGLADLAIAATAQQHGCTILNRNMRHFGTLGAPALDPVHALSADIR